MAYGAVVRWSISRLAGKAVLTISVHETEAAAASEWSTVNSTTNLVYGPDGALRDVPIPESGEIGPFQATLVSGTGTTIQPRLGKRSGWSASTQADIGGQASAAANVNDATPLQYANINANPAIFGKSVVSAGTDNVVQTIFTLRER